MNVIFRLKKLFNTIPRFYCSERCKAPNAFYSGVPFLSLPSDGKLKIKESESKDIEWQIWTSVNDIEDLKVFINQQEIHDTERYTSDGMVFTMKKQDVQFFGKYVKIQANVRIERNPDAIQWTISVANNKDGEIPMGYIFYYLSNNLYDFKAANMDVQVLLQKDAFLGEWSDWSSCSLTCIKEDSENFGIKTRMAKCTDGINGGLTCLDLIGDASQTKEEKVNCAGEIKYCQVNHQFLPWTSWSNCPNCVYPSEPNVKQRRTRTCIDGRYGGSKCPWSIK